jgi:hypothetical protein
MSKPNTITDVKLYLDACPCGKCALSDLDNRFAVYLLRDYETPDRYIYDVTDTIPQYSDEFLSFKLDYHEVYDRMLTLSNPECLSTWSDCINRFNTMGSVVLDMTKSVVHSIRELDTGTSYIVSIDTPSFTTSHYRSCLRKIYYHDKETVWFKGDLGVERAIRREYSDIVEIYEGGPGREKIIRVEMPWCSLFLQGESGQEHIVRRVDNDDGDVTYFEGSKGNEHITMLVSEADKVKLYFTGDKGHEYCVRKEWDDGTVHYLDGQDERLTRADHPDGSVVVYTGDAGSERVEREYKNRRCAKKHSKNASFTTVDVDARERNAQELIDQEEAEQAKQVKKKKKKKKKKKNSTHFEESIDDLIDALEDDVGAVVCEDKNVDDKVTLCEKCDDDDTKCIICMTNAKTQAMIPCGHLCLCLSCLPNVIDSDKPQCPMCREILTGSLRVFT